MRKVITVTIKKEHWDAGLKNAFRRAGEIDGELLIHDNRCPLALALIDKLGMSGRVNGSVVKIDGQRYDLDSAGSNFVAVFDDHEEEYVPKFPVKVKLTLCQPEKSGK